LTHLFSKLETPQFMFNKKKEEEKILYTKKTITQDTNNPEVEWVELDIYNFYKDQNNEDKTIH
tara:strand:+ start:228 stop:416 length:189 start_codon:yes stop_codon:yes gene_type:complete